MGPVSAAVRAAMKAAAKAAAETDFRIPAYAVKGVRDDLTPSDYGSAVKNYARDVENVPIEWLRNLPGNALRHGDDRINQYMQSILSDGLSNPLIINVGKNSGTAKLGEGNHRLEAMRRAGFTHIPARVEVGSQYGYDLLPRSDFGGDLIPETGEYFPSTSSPSRVFKSLKGVTKARGGRVSSFAVKRGKR